MFMELFSSYDAFELVNKIFTGCSQIDQMQIENNETAKMC